MYLIQSQISLVLLYVLYRLILRNQSSFRFNRFFLLISVLSSMLLPLIDYSFINTNSMYYVQLPAINVGVTNEAGNSTLILNSANIFLIVYVLISTLLVGKLIWDLISIYRVKRKSKVLSLSDQKIDIRINPVQNFSFFNWIFIKENDQENDAIIEHEKAHSQLFHSLDIVIIKIFQSVFWFNPLVFIIERELRLQHEYEVDQWVLRKHHNILDYQQILLNQVFHTEFNLVTNNFNQSFLKNRFTMMTRRENKKRRPLLLFALFAISILTPILFSCSMESKEEDKSIVPIEENKKSEVISKEEIGETEEFFLIVEEMPQFPGGNEAMFKYIGENLEYPTEAKEAGIEGRVFVEFIVEKDGSISNVKIIRGIGHGCDEATKKIVESMPNWEPGKQRGETVRVAFRMPVKFALQ